MSKSLIDLIASKAAAKVKKDTQPQFHIAVIILAVIGFFAIAGVVAYLVYQFLQPEYYDGYDEELFDEEFDEE